MDIKEINTRINIVDNKLINTSAVLNILIEIRPNWDSDSIDIQYQHEMGYYNHILKCSESRHPDDIILLRIFTKEVEQQIDHDIEFKLLSLLHKAGVAMPIYCKFGNGYAYKYEQGEVLSPQQMGDDLIIQKVFNEYHKLHKVQVAIPERYKKCRVFNYFIDGALNYLNSASATSMFRHQKFQEAAISPQKLIDEMKQAQFVYKQLQKKFPLVICHMDIKQQNIIFNRDKDTVQFIDWDLMGIEPEVCDIASYFIRTNEGLPPDLGADIVNDKSYKRKIMTMYLSTHPVYMETNVEDRLLDIWLDGFDKALYICEIWDLAFFLVQPEKVVLEYIEAFINIHRYAQLLKRK